MIDSVRRFTVGGAAAICVTLAPTASAQMPCDEAHHRVDTYYRQVKAFADGEAYQAIPMRCGPDWNCGNWWISRLNVWFHQQVNLVNMWHARIHAVCAMPVPQPAPSPPRNPLPTVEAPAPEPRRTVMIEIPSTPQGYRP